MKKRFARNNLDLIKNINEVILLYKKHNNKPTPKQIFNKLVSEKKIGNENKDYKRLSTVISNARIAGLIGWEDIRGRRQPSPLDIEL